MCRQPLLFIFLCLFSLTAFATSAPFQAGKDYRVLKTPLALEKGKVPVVEFFSYGCPWCYHFEPALDEWLQANAKNIDFQRVPVVFEADWLPLAKTYYALEGLDEEKQMTPLIFKAIHEQHMNLNAEPAIAAFLAKHGVSSADFDNAYHFSPGIDAQLVAGNNLMVRYRITMTPTVVIAGKYAVNTGMTNGDFKRMTAIMSYLSQKAQTQG